MERKRTILQELKSQLYEVLDRTVTATCVYVDVPNHANVGDHLIAMGTWQWLKESNRSVLYGCLSAELDFEHLAKQLANRSDVTVLLGGGGNLGGLYPVNDDLRQRILERSLGCNVVVLPQSIYVDNSEYADNISRAFKNHGDVTIICREKVSEALAYRYFGGCKIELSPDMAFALGGSLLNFSAKQKNCQPLLLKRQEGEARYGSVPVGPSIETSEWATFKTPSKHRIGLTYRLRRFLARRLGMNSRANSDELFNYNRKVVQSGLLQFSGRTGIISDRLHAHILASLMGIPNVLLDNSYHKNSSMFQTWTNKIEWCAYSGNAEHAESLLQTLIAKCGTRTRT